MQCSRVLRRRRRLLGGALDRSGARHCYQHGAAAARASDVVPRRHSFKADRLIPMCHSVREASRARIAVRRLLVHNAVLAAGSSADARASREALAAVLAANPAPRQHSASLCDRCTARDNVLDFAWLVSYMPLAPAFGPRWRRRRALLPSRHSSLQSSSRRNASAEYDVSQSARRPVAGIRVSALVFQTSTARSVQAWLPSSERARKQQPKSPRR